MDKNIIDGSYTRYRMPTEEDLAKSSIRKKETSAANSSKNSQPAYIIETDGSH